MLARQFFQNIRVAIDYANIFMVSRDYLEMQRKR